MISRNTRGEMGAPRFQPRPPSEIVKRPEAEDNIAESRWDGGFLRGRVMEGTVHHIMMDFGMECGFHLLRGPAECDPGAASRYLINVESLRLKPGDDLIEVGSARSNVVVPAWPKAD